MADELKINTTMTLTNGTHKFSFNPSTISVDQAAQGSWCNVVNIATSAETVAPTELATEGYAVFQNLDATNFVEIGPDSTGIVNFIKLKPGEFAILRLAAAVTIKAKADTAAIELYVAVLED